MSMPIIVPGTVTLNQAISDIIESVALEQTGLSHIINAEGEKIQRVVNGGGTIAEVLAVNCSVLEMIKAISRLEMVLEMKLDLFSYPKCCCVAEPVTTP